MSPHSYILFVPFHAASGRTDVVNTINDFAFTPASKSAFENFTIVDDSVLEFDELFIAEFNFGPEISNKWNVSKGEPSTAFIRIIDDDCELCSDSTIDLYNSLQYLPYELPSGNSLSASSYLFSC